MTGRLAVAVVALLAIAVVGLGVGLAVAIMDGGDNNAFSGMAHRQGGSYGGMMGAMAMMDADAMLERMREVLGEEGYQAMLAHMQAHRDGTAGPYAPGIDGLMHQMMDGMMSMMDPDARGHMFPNSRMPMPGMPRR
jgi:hypothetical protein